MFCEVYLLDAPYHLDCPYDYACSDTHRVGMLVRVPFGRNNSLRQAIITRLKDRPDTTHAVKSVHSVLGESFALDSELFGIARFIDRKSVV